MPSDLRSIRMTDLMKTFGKFEGSSTSLPVTSFKLWRTLKSFIYCCWALFHCSRTSKTILQTSSLFLLCGRFLSFCLGNSSSELSIKAFRCHFFGVGADGLCGAGAISVDGGVDAAAAAAATAAANVAADVILGWADSCWW